MNIPRAEHPRPQFERDDWQNLNGYWTFTFDPGNSGAARGLSQSRGFGEKILVPFCPESRLSGVEYTDFIETMWYHRAFRVKDAWQGRRVLLHFGGVDFYAEVYVNGRLAGRHWGGASRFSVDITTLVDPGSDNQLVVRVRDLIRSMTQPAGKQRPEYKLDKLRAHYTRTTGIWQTVWLEAVPGYGLKEAHVVPDLINERFLVTPRFYSWGAPRGSAPPRTLRIIASLIEGEEEPFVVEAPCMQGVPIPVPISRARAWEPGSPSLYRFAFELLDSTANLVDRVESYSGLRSVRVEDGKMLLNEKPLYQRFVLDQGFYPDGLWTAPSESDLEQDIRLSMSAGFNGARLHQKVFEDRYHFAADRLGYLTWAEAPSWGMDNTKIESARNFLAEWRAIVTDVRNHPSVVAWTPLNETIDPMADPLQHNRFHEDVYDLTRSLDPTRPVNDASGYVHVKTDLWTSHDYTQDPGTLASMLSMKADGDVYRNFPEWEAPYRGQAYLIDEFGGILWVPEQKRRGNVEGSWGYGKGPESLEEFYRRLEGLVDAVLAQEYIVGYCYTQLTDVEQEQNGIYTYERGSKFDMNRIRKVFCRTPKDYPSQA